MAIRQEMGEPQASQPKSTSKRAAAAWIGAGIVIAGSALYFGLKWSKAAKEIMFKDLGRSA